MARPKRVFTDEEIARIYDAALNNCHIDTIALALDIPKTTLDRRFGAIIRQLRAKGRVNLRCFQERLSRSSPDMAKFLGKNTLGQVDKQEVKTIIDSSLAPTEAERGALQAAADAYKRSIARQHNIKLKQA